MYTRLHTNDLHTRTHVHMYIKPTSKGLQIWTSTHTFICVRSEKRRKDSHASKKALQIKNSSGVFTCTDIQMQLCIPRHKSRLSPPYSPSCSRSCALSLSRALSFSLDPSLPLFVSTFLYQRGCVCVCVCVRVFVFECVCVCACVYLYVSACIALT